MSGAVKLNKSGRKAVLTPFFWLFVQFAVFFVAAGHMYILKAWSYFTVAFLITVINSLYMWRYLPALANERGSFKKDTLPGDRMLLPLFLLVPAVVTPLMIGLDIGRFGWSRANVWLSSAALCLFVLADFFDLWAMTINTYFEGTIRIQKDRAHKVISAGPYHYVRHPGYLSMIAGLICVPLIFGSLVGLIPALFSCAVLIVRTKLEDDLLKKELIGYAAYADKVRFRLLPGIW